MTNILHLSYELRDRENRKTTTAVKNLIHYTSSISSPLVIDLIRVNSFVKEKIEIDDRGHLNINAFGLPYGILMRYHLKRAYSFIQTAEQKNLISFNNIDAVHAHKVSFEGYIGYEIARRLNRPLILTLRHTDFTVFRYRPDLFLVYKKIMKSANKIVYLVPSMLNHLKRAVGKHFYETYLAHKLYHIPNIIVGNAKKQFEKESYLLTALSFTKKDVKTKNLKNLLLAVAKVDNLDIKLKIAGGGVYEPEIRKWITEHKLDDKVELLGHIPHDQIDEYFARASAFVMPSYSESFGMVYAESLLNGTPILYSKGVLGFDGFFENVGVGVDPYSVEDIRKGLIELITNNTFYRTRVNQLQTLGGFNVFSPEYVKNMYAELIAEFDHSSPKELIY